MSRVVHISGSYKSMNKFSARFGFAKHDFVKGSLIIRTLNDVTFTSDKYGKITVPAGTLSDGASVPRIFWTLFSPYDGDYFDAAVIHDTIYRDPDSPFTRYEADLIFLEAMENIGVGWLKRKLVFRAVRIGGSRAWKSKRDSTVDFNHHY